MPGFGTRKRITAARMRHRAWLQAKTRPTPPDPDTDDRGKPIFVWTNVHTQRVPCELAQLYSNELERARQLHPAATHRVTFRHINGILPQMRFLIDDRQFYIGAIENLDEANRFLVAICEELIA